MSNRYDEAAKWAEHKMTLPANSNTALRGEAAADFGRDLIERSRGGRPSIDPNKTPGEESRKRQVRLGDLDPKLDAFVEAHHTNASVVLRAALAEYLERHPLAG